MPIVTRRAVDTHGALTMLARLTRCAIDVRVRWREFDTTNADFWLQPLEMFVAFALSRAGTENGFKVCRFANRALDAGFHAG